MKWTADTIFTQAQRAAMVANCRASIVAPGGIDHRPVVKLFNPCGAGTWLLTELDDGDPDQLQAFGLCDLGFGSPELGWVSINELIAARLPFGLTIERDIYWTASAPLSAYADAAQGAGHIVDRLPRTAQAEAAP